MDVSPESLQSLVALAFGFAVAGLFSTGYQDATKRPMSFRLLESGPRPATHAAVPLLAFAAPFLVMRTSRTAPRNSRRFQTVMLATVVAGVWSLMSGTVVLMILQAAGL